MALFKKKTASDESYYMASQWTLMWRKLQKHKLAKFSLVILAILYIGALFADFFAPYGLEEFSSLYKNTAPTKVYWQDEEGNFSRPYVHKLQKVNDRKTFKVIITEDTSKKYYIDLFVEGGEYKLFGLIPCNTHLYGLVDENGNVDRSARINIFGADSTGACIFSRILFGGRVSLTIPFVSAAISFVLGILLGGIIIAATYIFYYVGVAGGATNDSLIKDGATVASTNIFGNVFGNILNLFIVISCLGTTNGLMLACTRSMYSLSVRKEGPKPEVFSQVDKHTNMPHNSAIFALLVTAAWFLYFYGANLAGWAGKYFFDSSELPIITIYAMYLPILVQWMRKEKEQNVVRRFVLPILAICGSLFMMFACAMSHKMGCVYYLIVFAVIMGIGALANRRKA